MPTVQVIGETIELDGVRVARIGQSVPNSIREDFVRLIDYASATDDALRLKVEPDTEEAMNELLALLKLSAVAGLVELSEVERAIKEVMHA